MPSFHSRVFIDISMWWLRDLLGFVQAFFFFFLRVEGNCFEASLLNLSLRKFSRLKMLPTILPIEMAAGEGEVTNDTREELLLSRYWAHWQESGFGVIRNQLAELNGSSESPLDSPVPKHCLLCNLLVNIFHKRFPPALPPAPLFADYKCLRGAVAWQLLWHPVICFETFLNP